MRSLFLIVYLISFSTYQAQGQSPQRKCKPGSKSAQCRLEERIREDKIIRRCLPRQRPSYNRPPQEKCERLDPYSKPIGPFVDREEALTFCRQKERFYLAAPRF